MTFPHNGPTKYDSVGTDNGLAQTIYDQLTYPVIT